MTNRPRPPAHVEPYVRILGYEGAVAFILEFGGAEIYLPLTRAAAARSPVAQRIGTDAVMALGEAGLSKRVPTAKPWLARVFRSDDLRVPEIARKLHVTDVTVRKWLKDEGGSRWADDRQMPLF
ncbi:helix-turn-helix domain-containing protein [Pararhodobacter zhoushanensis]|uniref:Helix-turn-helix domain-containing protein n=1 Tax=Pararhodobacter zhoushanensis TaxID=2479545 RepID=A0ABT3H2U8_9RHOB|nr:helix-turn-helix domain-containing protein [Pararhodobacter zhoushanensis]MCW1934102.1 helix-turn-helix domain-containing protein [Pararhodobacter zhoushanensis]